MPPPNRQWTPVPERVDNYRELKQLQRRQHFEFQRQVLDAYKGICSSIGISRNERRQQQQQQQEQQEQESPKIIFVRGEPKKLRAGQIAIIISEELHLKYRTGIYLCGLLYVLICCACWFNVSIFGITFYNVLRVPYYVWYFIGIFVTVILHCCPRTQDIFPFNLMLIILYLALEILFSAYIMHMVSWKHILICMAITIVVMTVGYFIGARFSNRLPSERWLYCIGFVLMFPVLLTFILALYFRNPIFWLAFGIFFFMYVGTLIPYHGRIIHLRGNDDTMPSLSVTAILILSDFVECVVPFLIYYMYYRYTKTGEWYMNSII